MRTAQECREALERSPLYRRREHEAILAHQVAKMRAWQYCEEDPNRQKIMFRIVEVRA
jgi:hypothetical protein